MVTHSYVSWQQETHYSCHCSPERISVRCPLWLRTERSKRNIKCIQDCRTSNKKRFPFSYCAVTFCSNSRMYCFENLYFLSVFSDYCVQCNTFITDQHNWQKAIHLIVQCKSTFRFRSCIFVKKFSVRDLISALTNVVFYWFFYHKIL